MNLLNSVELKVGLMVLTISGIIGYITLATNEDPAFMSRARYHSFVIDDASGIVKSSIVKSSGIRIGIIRDIKLEGSRARVEVTLDKDAKLTTSAVVEIKATGILGDKYVNIYLGDQKDPELKSGEEILNVENKGSFDKVMANVGEVSDSLKEIANVLKSALTGKGKNDSVLGQTMENLKTVTADLKEFTQGNKKDLSQIVSNIKNISTTLNDFINDETDDGFKTNFKKMSQSLAKVDKILNNIDDITSKVNRGEGTIGKLVNDDKIVTQLNEAIDGVNSYLGVANRVQTSLDLHSEYLAQQSLTKSYLGVRIQPGLDRYYELQLVNDPKGVISRKTTTDVSGGVSTTTAETVTYQDQLKFTALFAKNFYDFTVKGGMIENSAGVGAEYKFFRRKLSVSSDFFGFSQSPVHARANVKYNLFYGLYLTAGADDFFNQSNYSTFVGAGLNLNNDDLMMFLSKVP